MRKPQKITEIWAWVCTDPDGGEGVPASSRLVAGHVAPLLGADEERVRAFEDEARALARLSGYPLKLMRFTHAEVVEDLGVVSD